MLQDYKSHLPSHDSSKSHSLCSDEDVASHSTSRVYEQTDKACSNSEGNAAPYGRMLLSAVEAVGLKTQRSLAMQSPKKKIWTNKAGYYGLTTEHSSDSDSEDVARDPTLDGFFGRIRNERRQARSSPLPLTNWCEDEYPETSDDLVGATVSGLGLYSGTHKNQRRQAAATIPYESDTAGHLAVNTKDKPPITLVQAQTMAALRHGAGSMFHASRFDSTQYTKLCE